MTDYLYTLRTNRQVNMPGASFADMFNKARAIAEHAAENGWVVECIEIHPVAHKTDQLVTVLMARQVPVSEKP